MSGYPPAHLWCETHNAGLEGCECAPTPAQQKFLDKEGEA